MTTAANQLPHLILKLGVSHSEELRSQPCPTPIRAPRAGMRFPRLSARTAAGLALTALLGACATVPPAPPPPAPPPPRPTLTEMMKEAQDSAQAGAKDKARSQLTDAAKSYPTQKEPWVKLAEDYFETADYGNAILAAQEVTQRDPLDRTAYSILAVSGLRVASTALVTLRDQQSGMPTDTRSEARNLTKTLRETLGEPLLVPPVVPAPTPAARPTRANRANSNAAAATAAGAAKPAAVAPATAQAPAAGASAAAAAAKPAAKPAADKADKPANPFDRLR